MSLKLEILLLVFALILLALGARGHTGAVAIMGIAGVLSFVYYCIIRGSGEGQRKADIINAKARKDD